MRVLPFVAGIAALAVGILHVHVVNANPLEAEVLAFEAQDHISPPPTGSIVVTGSSTIKMWTTIGADLSPLGVIPRGFGGSTTDDLDYYLERIVLVYQPRAVVIYEGDNDISNGQSPQYVADHIANILWRISQRLPAARVYVIGIKPSPARWNVWPQSQQANSLLAGLCAGDARYTYINVAPPLLGGNGQPRPELYAPDTLHFNSAGYAVWNSVIRPVLLAQQLSPLPYDGTAPSAPYALGGNAVTTHRIDVHWNAGSDYGSGLAGYAIYRNGSRIATITGTYYADTSVAANSTYAYAVSAVDRATPYANESYQSSSVSITTAADPTPAPSVSLATNPSTLHSGEYTQLTWSSSNATACNASGGWSGAVAGNGSTNSTALFANTTFTLNCSGPGGNGSASAAVTVLPPVPTVTLTANPATVANGSSTQLSWNSTNAGSCSASGAWGGSRATSGTEASAPLTANVSYTLTCTGAGGSGSVAVTVNVLPPAPTVTLTAVPGTLASGGNAQLSWSSSHATSCIASGAWSGSRAIAGTETTVALTSNASYTLTCTGAGGATSASTAVVVGAGPPSPPSSPPTVAPTVTLGANPVSVHANESTRLAWSSANATSCTASGSWSGNRGTSGAETSAPLTGGASYSLTCTGPGGTVNAVVDVAMLQTPTVTLTASPATLTSGAAAQLSWSSTQATGCTASGDWIGAKAVTGAEQTAPLSANATYILTCTGTGGTSTATASVAVSASPATPSTPAPSNTPPATASATGGGGGGAIEWSEIAALVLSLVGQLRRSSVKQLS